MKISVVIPTRNRPDQVQNVLTSLAGQSFPAAEIIVVDASDDALDVSKKMMEMFHALPLKWLRSDPSVCLQRNKGINASSAEWIFLCDDDITLPRNHFEELIKYVAQHPTCGAVAGRLRQWESDQWVDQYPAKKFTSLLYHFIFQLSVWGSLDGIETNQFFRPLLSRLQRWYRARGNRESLAGWPLITQWGDIFTTRFYSLGANLIKRKWLLDSPYDAVLDRGGIGDNYGVAMGFPGSIHVVNTTYALHHRAQSNRVDRTNAYYRRMLALHYFIITGYTHPKVTSRWLCWSLIGLCFQQLFRADFSTLRMSVKALFKIATGENPYVVAKRNGENFITVS